MISTNTNDPVIETGHLPREPQASSSSWPMSPPSVKRKLPEDTYTGYCTCKRRKKPSLYQKHEKHWYLDGNILLQVGDMRFRVHRSRLELESRWFRDLINCYDGIGDEDYEPQEDVGLIADAAHRVDDTPLFYLDAVNPVGQFIGTAVEGVSYLLSALYQKTTDYACSAPTTTEISILYQAAHRYKVKRYQSFCEKYLEKILPDFSRRVSEPASVKDATLGLLIGQQFGLQHIKARALHDLARVRLSNVSGEMRDITRNSLRGSKQDFPAIETKIVTDFVHVTALQKYLKQAWIDITEELIEGVWCNPGLRPALCPSLDSDTSKLFLDTIQAKFPNDTLMAIHECLHGLPTFTSFYCTHSRRIVTDLLLKRRTEICDHLMSNWTGHS